ncbi:MAG: hypothetical protein HOK63_03365 [Thaumarchaeota archaeon]|jgi:hypothetical protein|nr:hypothetical protein [Nitrososphaerota archaeon]MBT5842187.1 hypothetical protein [Nitrososphaerota archaeon]MBT6468676.1 hypothetical protein [Nitrososphaerota archaeon]
MTDDKKMKIICKWCSVSEICHIVSQEIKEHQGNYGIDSVMMAKVKIHKHFKGKNYCKGSNRTIIVPLDETIKYNEKLRD